MDDYRYLSRGSTLYTTGYGYTSPLLQDSRHQEDMAMVAHVWLTDWPGRWDRDCVGLM